MEGEKPKKEDEWWLRKRKEQKRELGEGKRGLGERNGGEKTKICDSFTHENVETEKVFRRVLLVRDTVEGGDFKMKRKRYH